MLTISSLTYRIAGELLFEETSVRIGSGRCIGIVGRNGCGKTTLLKLIQGIYEPDSGDLSLVRDTSIAAVDQEILGGPTTPIEIVLAADKERKALLSEADTALDPERIVEIQIRLSDIGAHSAPSRAATILAGLGINETAQNEPIENLSGGWRMRVSLAATLFAEPDLLLLDEPTNHLDLEAAIWLESYLKNYPRTILLVSHDRHLLNNVADGILHIESRVFSLYPGGYDDFAKIYAERQSANVAYHLRQEAKKTKLEEFVKRFRYNASKARQAQSRLKALQRLNNVPVVAESRDFDIEFPKPKNLAPPLATLLSVTAGYVAETAVLENLDLQIDPNDRIALLGANGNGKSTFARVLAGQLKPFSGQIVLAPKISIGYFAQHQIDTLDINATAFGQLSKVMSESSGQQVRARLGSFGFSQDKVDVLVGNLSGGEKARLNFAIISASAPQILVLDEPTNHLDLQTRDALIESLNNYPGAVLLISHDWDLIELTTERLWIVKNRTIHAYDGDLENYRREILGYKELSSPKQKGMKKNIKGKTVRQNAVAARQKRIPLQKALESAEYRLNQAKQKKANLEAHLAELVSVEYKTEQFAELSKTLSLTENTIIRAETDWFEALESLEAIDKS